VGTARGRPCRIALIENVAPDNLLARHEVFGPVLSVIAVNDVN